MRIVKVLHVFAVMLLMFAAAMAQSDTYESVRADYDNTVRSGKASRNVYTSLGDRFYKVYISAPDAKNADNALLYAGKSYKLSYENYDNKSDMEAAHNYLRKVSAGYETEASAEAYLESAELYIQKRDLASAQLVLKRVQVKFPGSYHELAAASMLDDLTKMAKNSGTVVDNSYVMQPVVANNPRPPIDVVVSTATPIDEVINAPVTTSQVSMPNITPGTVVVQGVRYHSNADYTRIVIDLSKDAQFEKHWLKENPELKMPPRLFLDIYDSVVADSIPRETDIKDGLISKVRWAYNKPGVTRIVLDSESIETFTVFPLADPARIIIDVSNQNKYPALIADATPVVPPATGTIPKPVVQPPSSKPGPNDTLASMMGLKITTVVIDPGHGGKDPGANIPGLKEKDIVLDIGKELKRLLEKNTKLKVYMTRENDTFIPLEDRPAFANKHNADLFISIHVNQAPNPAATGVESWVLNVTSDKDALELAAKENQSTTKNMSDLQGILKDIVNNHKLEESLMLASALQNGMSGNLKLGGKRNRGIKQSTFYVLMGTQHPAVLVEVGFISNKDEAAKLKTQEYRKQVAKGLYDGVITYVNKYNK